MAKRKSKKKTKSVRKIGRKRITAKKTPKEKLIGRVSHYFDKIQVAAISLEAPLAVGDTIRIEGGGRSFLQKVVSMEREHQPIPKAKKGDEIGVKVKEKVHEGYRVFKVG